MHKIACVSCAGSGFVTMFAVPRAPDEMSFSAYFATAEQALDFCDNKFSPRATNVNCKRCAGKGIVNPPTCSFCHGDKKYIAIVDGQRQWRACEICSIDDHKISYCKGSSPYISGGGVFEGAVEMHVADNPMGLTPHAYNFNETIEDTLMQIQSLLISYSADLKLIKSKLYQIEQTIDIMAGTWTDMPPKK